MKALSPAEATEAIRAQLLQLNNVAVPLRASVGRVLRQTVMAERDNPPFDRVCMDGVAVASRHFSAAAHSENQKLKIIGTQAAGAVPLHLDRRGTAIEVMTGAVMPAGTDCVIPLEEYDLVDDTLTLKPDTLIEPFRNVQRRGCDSARDAPMLVSGCKLGAAEVAVLASAGLNHVQVSQLPRIKVISTGDELIEPGEAILDHQVRRSNAYAVLAALQAHGYSTASDDHLIDDADLMQLRLSEHLQSHDLIVLSGGVSKGKFDHVPTALKNLGVKELFREVAQRPGRPLWFGIGPKGQVVFGLPGNPVSTLICLVRYVLPALQHMMGANYAAPARLALAAASGGRKMTYFMPFKQTQSSGTAGLVQACPPQGSGDFLALAGTAGFLELPPNPAGYEAGFAADAWFW